MFKHFFVKSQTQSASKKNYVHTILKKSYLCESIAPEQQINELNLQWKGDHV